ncbi:MAG: hypothetical protein KDA60_17805 [Planctomycetales bacterium]|nr:hypothetical protein [Planctomycetales bacterium]
MTKPQTTFVGAATDGSRVQFSVDLVLGSHQTSLSQHRELARTTHRLLNIFAQAGIPATWTCAELDSSAVVDALATKPTRHEIALLATPSWAGNNVSRVEFARELEERIHDAVENGFTLRTLAMHEVNREADLDILARHDVRVIRTEGEGRQARPATIRHGITRVPVSARIPVASFFDRLAGSFRTRLHVKRLMARDNHVVLHAADYLEDTHSRLRTLEVFVDEAARAVAEGRCVVENLAEVGQRLRPIRVAQPSRSILRPAA